MNDSSTRRFRIPYLGWLGLAAFLLIIAALALSVWLPIYRQQALIADIRSLGGSVETRPGPVWGRWLVDAPELDDVVVVRLSGCRGITHQMLKRLSVLHSLEELYLSEVQVGDSRLEHLAGLPNLQVLTLSGTLVTDKGMRSIGELASLQELSLTDTRIGGEGLKHLHSLTNLKRLWLHETRVDDAGLKSLRRLVNLRELSLGQTQVSSEGLRHLSGMKLGLLALNDTMVDDEGLQHLTGLAELEQLVLDGTKISDDGLRHLKQLRRLKLLTLNHTRVGENGLRHLHQMKNLRLMLIPTRTSDRAIDRLRKAMPWCRIEASHLPKYKLPDSLWGLYETG